MPFKKGQSGNSKGRPKGSTTKPRFADYVSDDERKKFVEFVLDSYMGDMRLTTWMGDQIFGKAHQAMDVTTDGESLHMKLSDEQYQQLIEREVSRLGYEIVEE